MSIIQTIRDKATWAISIIIGLSLIGFLLMDAGNTSAKMRGEATSIGTVEGRKIDAKDYDAAVKGIEDQYKQMGFLSGADMAKEQAWNQLVTAEIITKESEAIGIAVSPKELDDILYVNPPEDLKRGAVNEQGQFDPNILRQQLDGLKKSKKKEQIEGFNKYLIALSKDKARQKYVALLTNTAYYPKWMLEKMNSENSSMSSISYVSIPYASIVDTAKVSDEEISAYVNKHKSAYKQELTRSISFVAFDANPSSKDTMNLINNLVDQKAEMAATTEKEMNNFLAKNGSQQALVDKYVLKSKLQVPNNDTIKKLSEGSVFGPYLDANPQAGTASYTLAKMISIKNVPDSIKCRHILVKIAEMDRQTNQAKQIRDDSTAKKLIDSIALAIKNGASFNEMVVKFSEDDGSNKNNGEYEFGSISQLVPAFYETVFYQPVGTKKVVKGESQDYVGYHYIEVLSQKNFEPAYKVAYLSKPLISSQATEDSASGLANQFLVESRNAKAFTENAEKRKYMVMPVADIKPNDANIQQLGSSRELVRWLYKADKGDVAEQVYNLGSNYIVPMVTEINPEGTMNPSKARVMTENIIRNQRKAEQIKKKIGTANTLEAVATATGQQVFKADSISFTNPFLPNAGMESTVGGYAFNAAAKGKVSAPIVGNGGVYVVRTENIYAKQGGALNIEEQRKTMMMAQRSNGANKAMEVLKKMANIKDNRSEVY
jgi:peptidyl-prolyl cis-trans isomerase D